MNHNSNITRIKSVQRYLPEGYILEVYVTSKDILTSMSHLRKD